MEIKRKPFLGDWNIVRFNWHFYLLAILVFFSMLYFNHWLPDKIRLVAFWLAGIATFTTLTSLLISFYIYDLSRLYDLSWIPDSQQKKY